MAPPAHHYSLSKSRRHFWFLIASLDLWCGFVYDWNQKCPHMSVAEYSYLLFEKINWILCAFLLYIVCSFSNFHNSEISELCSFDNAETQKLCDSAVLVIFKIQKSLNYACFWILTEINLCQILSIFKPQKIN